MRFRTAAALAALGLTAAACGTGTSSTPSSPATSTKSAPAACSSQSTTGWVRIKDPSGVTFLFPAATRPETAKVNGAVTRTYVQGVCGNTAVSVTVVPTPKQLDTKNFFLKYPATLTKQGAKHVRPGAITALKLQGFDGLRCDFRYDQMPGPAPTYELREAVQLPKFFIILDTVAVADRKLTAKDLSDAKAVNAALLRGFTAK